MIRYIISNNRWEIPRYYYRRDWVKNPMYATAYIAEDIANEVINQIKRIEPKLQLMQIECDAYGSYALKAIEQQ